MANVIGFGVIALTYIGIGLVVVVGSVHLSQSICSPLNEQRFYALILIPVAAFYWACMAYFETTSAFALESYTIAVFIVLALTGLKYFWVLFSGYLLHGLWDGIHEVVAHADFAGTAESSFVAEWTNLTSLPLAYGIFCATYDIGIAVYFLKRRAIWRDARTAMKSNG